MSSTGISGLARGWNCADQFRQENEWKEFKCFQECLIEVSSQIRIDMKIICKMYETATYQGNPDSRLLPATSSRHGGDLDDNSAAILLTCLSGTLNHTCLLPSTKPIIIICTYAYSAYHSRSGKPWAPFIILLQLYKCLRQKNSNRTKFTEQMKHKPRL